MQFRFDLASLVSRVITHTCVRPGPCADRCESIPRITNEIVNHEEHEDAEDPDLKPFLPRVLLALRGENVFRTLL